MDEFKPDYRDMRPSDYQYKGKSLVQSQRGKALANKNYRQRNPEKIQNYEQTHPMLRVRVPVEQMRLFEQACKAAGEKPAAAVRRLIRELIERELSKPTGQENA